MKKETLGVLFLLLTLTGLAQNSPSIDTTAIVAPKNIKFNYKQLILPTVLIGYGVIGLSSGDLKKINLDIRSSVENDNHKKLTIDDLLQYTPAVSVFVFHHSMERIGQK